MTSAYDLDLDKTGANYQPLTPLTFLERSAKVYPDHPAIIHGALRRDYRSFYARSRQLASALVRLGIRKGDTVSVLLANAPPMPLESIVHFCCGAVAGWKPSVPLLTA